MVLAQRHSALQCSARSASSKVLVQAGQDPLPGSPLFTSASKLNSEMGREDRVSDPGVVDAANRPDFS
jgi:hypothetical protein